MNRNLNPGERRRADLERPLIERLADVLKLATIRDLGDDYALVALIGQEHDEDDEPTGAEIHGQITVGDLVPMILALAAADRDGGTR